MLVNEAWPKTVALTYKCDYSLSCGKGLVEPAYRGWVPDPNGTVRFVVLIRAYRGQHWKGKQNLNLKEKLKETCVDVFMKYQKYFKMTSFRWLYHIMLGNCSIRISGTLHILWELKNMLFY